MEKMQRDRRTKEEKVAGSMRRKRRGPNGLKEKNEETEFIRMERNEKKDDPGSCTVMIWSSNGCRAKTLQTREMRRTDSSSLCTRLHSPRGRLARTNTSILSSISHQPPFVHHLVFWQHVSQGCQRGSIGHLHV